MGRMQSIVTSVRLSNQNARYENRHDSPRSWMICFVNFITGFICFGIHCNFGLMHRFLVTQYKSGNALTAWLGSLAFAATFLFSPLSSVLCEMIRPSQVSLIGSALCLLGLVLSSFASNLSALYLTYGLCFGIGASCSYFPTVIVLKEYFKRYLNLANGISACGSGLGTMAIAPMVEHCLDKAGLRWTFRFLALLVVSMFIIQFAFIYIEKELPPILMKRTKKQFLEKLRKTIFGKELWSKKQYQMLVTSMAIFLFGYFVPYVHLVLMATTKGIPTMKAALLISYLSVSTVVGKILFGFLINFCKIQVHGAAAVSMFCIGVSNCVVPFEDDYTHLCIYAVICGLFEGCINGQIAIIVLKTIGDKMMSHGLANLFSVNAGFMMAGPAVAGFIFDQTNSYRIAFILSGCSNLIGAILMLYLAAHKFRKKPCSSSQSTSTEVGDKDEAQDCMLLSNPIENNQNELANLKETYL